MGATMATLDFTPIAVKAIAIDLFWLCERHVKVTRRIERIVKWVGRAR